MFRHVFKLLAKLDKKDIIRLYFSIIILTVVAVFELVGLALIAPYATLVFDTDSSLTKNEYWISVYGVFEGIDHSNFVFYVGLFIAAFVFLGNIFSIFSVFMVNKLSCYFGARLSVLLLMSYLEKSYLFHKETNSSILINNITQQCQRVVNGVFMPLMIMASKIITILLIGIGMFLLDPIATIISTLILFFFYMTLFLVVKNRLTSIGKAISTIYESQIKVLTEALTAIKLIKLNSLENQKIDELKFLAEQLANNNYLKTSIGQSIRYIVEGILFGVIAIALAIISQLDQSLLQILPTLVLVTLAGYKLLPCFQTIFHSLATIKSEVNAFLKFESHLKKEDNCQSKAVRFEKSVNFKQVSFSYPDKYKVLDSLYLTINQGEKIGIVGSSGGGKSTFIDVLLGLLPMDSGSILINNKTVVTRDTFIDWKNSVGYVPQEIVLVDGTIASNIAFGEDYIDEIKINDLLEICGLNRFVLGLDKGIYTKVGERGLKLSGGQRQRIGIARALYREPTLLVLDEATSALDSLTENQLNKSISNLKDKLTQVVIAHRISTLRDCDRIYVFGKGNILDFGTYEELMIDSTYFQRLAGKTNDS
ncbi:ABC transporter ATP-binding protein [Vibrio sp. 99-8-1]|uniref:ATP-binding cassette domain-containing protein n=1 Tax=Vibrio sp. 99-8-1 TaxID=2607602 RepID=UPI00149347F9|nr:ABC transporter ATP-binding protein [Vibrio sp. 99-8-1]